MSYVKTINEDGSVSDIMAKALDPTLDASLVHHSEVTQATDVTTAGKVADARVSKTLNDAINTLDDAINTLDGAVVKKSNLVNGFTQTTAGVNALDAVAGKTLHDRMDGLCSFGFNLPSGGSIALNVNNSARFMVVGTAPNTAVMFAILCATNGTGSATTVQDLYLGSAITHTSAQSKLTIANSNTSHSPKCLCIMFNNTPTVSV